MERFSCCSRYMECSDALACVHQGDDEYEGCNYRRKLEAGIVFYGKHAGMKAKKDPVDPAKASREFTIYLACFGQLFAVYSRQKRMFSFTLSEELFTTVQQLFDQKAIPYRTKFDFLQSIDGFAIEDDSPCNSRVVFVHDGQEFHVLNFNAYLIKPVYAERISKAFKNKGIDSRVELVGTQHGWKSNFVYRPPKQEPSVTSAPPTVQEQPVKLPEPEMKPITKFKQVTIFELMAAVG